MKAFLRICLALAFVCLAPLQCFAFDVPPLNGYRVNDHANLLKPEQRAALESALAALEQKTTAQVAILTVNDLQGDDIKSAALKVFDTWKLGQKGKDNGLLILYTVKEDRYRLEVGYGLEGAIPDGVAGDIIRHQLRAKADPKHGTNDFGGAFNDAVQRIAAIVAAEYASDPSGESLKGHKERSRSHGGGNDPGLWFFLALFAFFWSVQLGATHKAAGATVGGLTGAGLAWLIGFGIFGYAFMGLLGASLGFSGKFLQPFLSNGGGGGFGGGSFGGGGFSGSGGGFSGGGGSSGGGGADG